MCLLQILECEFYLLELMVSGSLLLHCRLDFYSFALLDYLLFISFFQDCCLIVYHPYRPLLQYVQEMGQEDMLLPLAWYDKISFDLLNTTFSCCL